ncbi:MAG: hypothetical protein M1812_006214 [Candelaria pacifica]|nr:MAG: hypothetical protein M1812_006214 [Candelaria pacifica]
MWEPLVVLRTKAICFVYCRDQSFEHLSSRLSFSFSILAVVGSVTIAYLLYILLDFLYLHLLRSSSLDRYLHTPNGPNSRPWALITGASDGIGKGFAEELCSKGFSVILHGRNEAKLSKVKASLNDRWPNTSIKLAVIDAAQPNNLQRIEGLASEFQGLDITILINNVGGSGPVSPMWRELHNRTGEEIDQLVDVNLRFATQLTRVMLPILLRNTPSLVLNVGSVCAKLPSPWLTVYAGGKAFNLAWSRSLTAEMQATGKNVEVLGTIVGEVQAQHSTSDTGLFIPSSRTMARAALGMVGCGRAIVTPHAGHALQMAVVGLLPEWMLNRLLIYISQAAKAEHEKGE